MPIPGFDVANATIAVPLWVAGAIAALFVVLGVVAIVRFGTNAAAGFMRISLVLIVAGLAWVYLERAGVQDRMAERSAFESRLAGLNAQANAPGSALACLNGMGGETVELGCEKAIFATPETVAAAVTYTSARLSLLADSANFARANPAHASGYAALKRSLEGDLFGLVSHVLATRDSCTGQQCDAFQFFSDASRVQANLRDQVYQVYVGRYAVTWPARNGRSVETPVAAAAPPAPMPMSSKYSFPSAASIPPVSIMNAEPGVPPAPPAAPPPAQAAAPPPPAAPPQQAAPPTPQRRPQAAPAPPRPTPPPRTANQQAPSRNQPLQLQAQPAAPPAAPPAAADSEPPPFPPPSVQ